MCGYRKDAILREIADLEANLSRRLENLKEIKEEAKKRAKELISKPTKAEIQVKYLLSKTGNKFEFQKIIDGDSFYYIVDFYLPKSKLIIEIDGEYHETPEQKQKDSKRERHLVSLGYTKIIRFRNKDIFNLTEKEFSKKLKVVLERNRLTPIIPKTKKLEKRIRELRILLTKYG